MRVLVVDDDPGMRFALCAGLESEGFEVSSVGDADAAYAAVATVRPDLILLDWRLPGDSGLVACRRLRERHPDAVIVMHSGLDDPRDQRAALEAGAEAFLRKGLPIADLAARLERCAPAGGG